MSNRAAIARTIKKNATPKSAQVSFREGWRDGNRGRTIPLSELWDGIEPTASKEEEKCDSD